MIVYGRSQIEIVNKFNYLSLIFNYNGSFFQTQKKLGEQGRKAVFCLKRIIIKYQFNTETKLSLFDDAYIGSIMSHASEVWGYHHGSYVEKVHTDSVCVKQQRTLSFMLSLEECLSHYVER